MTRGPGVVLLAFGLVLGFVGIMGTILALAQLPAWGPELLLVCLLIDVVSVVLLVGAAALIRRGRAVGEVPTPVDGKVGSYVPNAHVEQSLDGSPYTVLYTPPVKGKHSRPSSLIISTPASTTGEFEVAVETWFDRLCKRVGLAVEIETGDDAFDEACYVRTDAVEFTEAYLADPVKRVAIVDLRRFGFNTVSLDDGDVSVVWTGFDPLKHDKPDLTADVAARLILLARNLPEHRPEFDNRSGRHRKLYQGVLWVFLIGFALSMLSLIAFPPLAFPDLLLLAAPGLVLGWLTFGYVSALLLRGTSTSHYKWAGLMLGSLVLFPLGGIGTTALLNGTLDSSQPVVHHAPIVEKYTTRSKNKTKYHVRCASWREPGETFSYQVNSEDYRAVVPDQSNMVLTTQSGLLGVEWVASKRLEIRPPKP
jgi:hypothetical protein